ncbi:MAG: hypothetical protein H3C29_13370 [Simplicispira suum]|uniref:hypothetical protein n=1 Tax=Simplicispira suum TaxID=2109915 RepID=UPI001C6B55A8|nr:hypothetical protein [Simplicispira suum]MBW7834194.1 hypothetical protein [Simplicispira suum]
MTVIAKFTYEIQPGRLGDFLQKLAQAASPEFNSPSMPSAVRLFQSTVPGPASQGIQLHIEYPDMAAYGQRTTFEDNNPAWRALFAEDADSPQRLVSVELLTQLLPGAPA